MAIGHCAQTHTDLMLTELENVAKWEHTKKSGSGIFSFIKDAMPYSKGTDADVINLRATIILSYGYVILYCPTDMVTQRLDQTVLPFLRQYMNNFKVYKKRMNIVCFSDREKSLIQRSKVVKLRFALRRVRVRSRWGQFLFNSSKMHKNFCLGVFLCENTNPRLFFKNNRKKFSSDRDSNLGHKSKK
jgi:hypothetical protein